ncbi:MULTISPECIES: hypothetical protein [unclassified Cellulomonas]|uniref:hypothetical protein n=1 Tax=unclassified Cellulomonas TaxID=2620175 RepID=UPI0019BAF731|nr:hypothetical protein [Cellulomonas sp. ES6]MBD3780370.1 hypothetical protein [Micrococcales bacterium]WHP18959.1 hypothetical protein P9841_07540 [Cellulomonas sp. ES6]
MTTVTFDVTYGLRPVRLRLPYLSVRRLRDGGPTPRDPGARAARSARADRLADRVGAGREAALRRVLTERAGAGW